MYVTKIIADILPTLMILCLKMYKVESAYIFENFFFFFEKSYKNSQWLTEWMMNVTPSVQFEIIYFVAFYAIPKNGSSGPMTEFIEIVTAGKEIGTNNITE